MFDKSKFAKVIKDIKETYNSQEEFSQKSNIGRTYLSQYMNMKLIEPPKPKILKKLANSSNGIITYKELLDICGYSEKTLESNVLYIYDKLKEYHKYINNSKSDNDNFYEIEAFIESFQKYLYELEQSIIKKSASSIFLADIFDFSHVIEDYKYIAGFILIYNEFLKLLKSEDYINIIDYSFVDCLSIDAIYSNLYNFETLELLSCYSKNILLKSFDNTFLKYINNFSHCLSLAHLKDFDTNSLTELFKNKASNKKIIAEETINQDPFGLSEIGFNIKDYNPPTKNQKEQIKAMIEIILKENKKTKEK